MLNMGVSNTSDQMQIKIKMQNSSEEPPASFKASDQDLKDMDIPCTFKILMKSQNSEHGYKTSYHIPLEPQHPPKLVIRT